MALTIERTRLPLLVVLVFGAIALIFTVVALATKDWIIINTSKGDRSLTLGVWEYCIPGQCFSDMVVASAILTIITTVLISIALLATMLIFIIKRLPVVAAIIPVFLFFVAIIILFADVVIIWQEISTRSLPSSSVTKQDVTLLKPQYGFSSILLITSLPILIVCLVLVSFVAGALIIGRVVTNVPANSRSIETHYY